jgi:hypothetical protein
MKYKVNESGEIIKSDADDNLQKTTSSKKNENSITSIIGIIVYWGFYYVFNLIWGLGLNSVTTISGVAVLFFLIRILPSDDEDGEMWRDVGLVGKIFIISSLIIHSYLLYSRFANPSFIIYIISTL